ncbi:MAG: Do family serine endopeptidase [Bryobacteraceae bacterium]
MKTNSAVLVTFAAIAGSFVTFQVTKAPEAPAYVLAQGTRPGLTFAPMVRKVTPAVVSVMSEVRNVRTSSRGRGQQGQIPPGMEDLFRDFFGGRLPEGESPEPRRGGGMGSGVIVSPDGYILTNNHVVQGADRVTVSLQDRREFVAKVVGTDPMTDIAVIKVEGAISRCLRLAIQPRCRLVTSLMIGNPFGIGQTVTMGIIGATGRAARLAPGTYEDFIQTDAAINPGNSGGALVNTDGQLIGINTAIISRSGGNQGIGFAIPVNMAREVMDQLVKGGKVVRGYMGAGVQALTPDLARAFKLATPAGAVLTQIEPGSPASKAGLLAGDVVTQVNGEPVADENALRLRISRSAPGSTVTLKVQRSEGAKDIPVILGRLPSRDAESGEAPELRGGSKTPLNGVSVDELTSEIAQQLRIPENVRGVIVSSVDANSSAAEAGLRRGDVIQQVNRRNVTSVREFEQALGRGGDSTILLVNRGGIRSSSQSSQESKVGA